MLPTKKVKYPYNELSFNLDRKKYENLKEYKQPTKNYLKIFNPIYFLNIKIIQSICYYIFNK